MIDVPWLEYRATNPQEKRGFSPAMGNTVFIQVFYARNFRRDELMLDLLLNHSPAFVDLTNFFTHSIPRDVRLCADRRRSR